MPTERCAFQEMSRVLCGHRWRDLEEWVDAIRALADLSDADLAEIERCLARAGDPPTADADASPPRSANG